jgi:hypothetical protein
MIELEVMMVMAMVAVQVQGGIMKHFVMSEATITQTCESRTNRDNSDASSLRHAPAVMQHWQNVTRDIM